MSVDALCYQLRGMDTAARREELFAYAKERLVDQCGGSAGVDWAYATVQSAPDESEWMAPRLHAVAQTLG